MHILQIAHAFPPTVGGVETHLWDLGMGLADRGHTLTFVVGGTPQSRADDQPHPAVAVRRYSELTVDYLVKERATVARSERKQRLAANHERLLYEVVAQSHCDVIHAHNAHHFAPELAEAIAAMAGGRPIFNSVHDRVGEHIYPEVLNLPWSGVLYASHYLCLSVPTTRPFMVKHLSVDRRVFTSRGAKDERILTFERPVIFHPARLLRWKGILVGVEAFAQVRAVLGRGTLVLCESSNTVENQSEMKSFWLEVEALARQLKIESHVHLLPFSRAQMAPAYRASDLVWYPTIDDEPLGLVPMEAYSCRVPLVVSRSGGMVETVQDDVTGLIVPKGSAVALAAAAVSLLTNEERRSRLLDQAERQADQFSIGPYLDAIEEVYRWP